MSELDLQTSPSLPSRRLLSITELTQSIRRLLETQMGDILAEGEISGFKAAPSGHLYFDLKDSGALIRCIVWASDAARVRFSPKDGDRVEINGKLTVYDQRGQYQLRITSLRPAGVGKLYQAYIEMKDRLQAEGLFAADHKKPLPPFPSRIGLVTSPTGAVIRDMINVLTRRAPHIHLLLWPVRVQGEGSANEIAYAINRFNQIHPDLDILIIGRGGGSLEDLWAFNEEIVARAIYNSQIPTISAVGHETDTTIADFVADLRAPTPSAAAELVARDSGDLLQHLKTTQLRAVRAIRERMSFLKQTPHMVSRLTGSVLPQMARYRSQLAEFNRSYGIQVPVQLVNQEKQRHDELLDRINRALINKSEKCAAKHMLLQSQLRTLNPKAILKRGYSITYQSSSQKIVTRASTIKPGTPISIILGEGQIHATTGELIAGSVPRSRKTRKNNKSTQTIEWFGEPDHE